MVQVFPEKISLGQKIMVEYETGLTKSGWQRSTFIVTNMERCYPEDIPRCKALGFNCCGYKLCGTRKGGRPRRFCTRQTDRKFYLTTDMSKINKITEVE